MEYSEERFRPIVESVGGEKIDETSWPLGRKVADFVFPGEKVIAEFKSMVENKMLDSCMIQRVSELYERARSEGSSPIMVYGRARVSSDGFPDWYKRGVYDIYKKPIKRQVETANKQIKDTKAVYRAEAYSGLLILENCNNTAIGNEQAIFILQQIFKAQQYSGIDAVIYLDNTSDEYLSFLAFNRNASRSHQ